MSASLPTEANSSSSTTTESIEKSEESSEETESEESLEKGSKEMEVDHEEEQRPNDNLDWVEEVILNNLDDCYTTETQVPPPTEGKVQPTTTVEDDPTKGTLMATQNNQNENKVIVKVNENVKLLIMEIEMRDDNFFLDNSDEIVHTLSRIITARIKYVVEGDDDEEKLHFWVIKTPSPFEQERQIARFTNADLREICFYTEILPSIKLWVEAQDLDHFIDFKVPICYYGKYNRPCDKEVDKNIIEHILEAESLLVLQDLRAIEYGKRHFGEGMSTAEAIAAVTQITKFHAISWAMQQKTGESFKWRELYHWNELVKLYEPLFHRGFSLFENFLSNCSSSKVSDAEKDQILKVMTLVNENIRQVLTNLFKPPKNFISTIIHMDFWSDNLLFRVKESDREGGIRPEECDLDCSIIDWQMVSLGSPTHDLGLLTMLSMDAPLRQEKAHDLLMYYYDLFKLMVNWFELEVPFSFESLIQQYSSSCVLAVIMAISSMDLVIQEEAAQDRLILAIRDLLEDGVIPVASPSSSESYIK